MPGLRGNLRRRLDAGRSGADHADALAGEVHTFVRPLAGVVPLAREIGRPGISGTLAVDRQPTAVIEEFARRYVSPRLGAHLPAVGRLVVMRGSYAAVEPNVALQVEPLGDEFR